AWRESVPPAVVAERRARLLAIERETAEAYCRSLVGRRLDVLVEGADPRRSGFVRGTACRYVPVVCRGHAPALIRRRIPVRAVGVAEGVVLGEPEIENAHSTEYRADSRLTLPLIVGNSTAGA